MAIDTLTIPNQPETALNEKYDASAKGPSSPANPVIKSAEFALLVSVYWLSLSIFLFF
jgi:hypothetical protein